VINGELTLAHRAMDAFVVSTGHSQPATYAKVVLHTSLRAKCNKLLILLATLPSEYPIQQDIQYVLGNICHVAWAYL